MVFVKIGLLLLALGASGCNDANLAGGAKKATTERNKGASPGEKETPLGTRANDADDPNGIGGSGDNGLDDRNGKTGETGDGTKSGDLGESDDLITLCPDTPLKTSVKLLTPTIQNGKPGNKVAYELQLIDCKGNPRPISAQFIHFDLDAEVDDTVENGYVASVGGQTITGTLQVVDGVDLFGKKGPEYFHHKTDQPVTLTTAALTATLTIDLRGQLHSRMGGDDEGGSFSCQSYLRFGDADPVAQTVTFVE